MGILPLKPVFRKYWKLMKKSTKNLGKITPTNKSEFEKKCMISGSVVKAVATDLNPMVVGSNPVPCNYFLSYIAPTTSLVWI